MQLSRRRASAIERCAGLEKESRQQIRDLAAQLEEDETLLAHLDEQIQALKLEIVSDE